ncbi:hypothetical protein [Leifsonia sp. TF02-11]|uniref:hypothetical protein n=1 Tax=Leifsonia sp. TF02-11 TaxID=2815212 RepID=UPI001AA16525|nr:hypothetical protein [Leifsonia sp. TF02-11]MBO1739165.1 hypothetical protein [Leifsonia sp. TF02-11]
MRPARGRYRRPLVVAATVLALGLTGCAGGDGYSAQTARTLQHGVLAVATAAEANDLAGAQARLAALAKLNDAALAKGEISSARHAAIESSIVAVRADLTQLQDQVEKERLQQQLQQLQQQQQQHDQKGKGKGKDKGDDQGGDG